MTSLEDRDADSTVSGPVWQKQICMTPPPVFPYLQFKLYFSVYTKPQN